MNERDNFIPTLEKEFPDILNEMLGCNSQQQPLNSNKNWSMPQRNREEYNSFRWGINSRITTLTTPSPTITHQNTANRSHHFLHSMPETLNTHNGIDHFTQHTYQVTQTTGHAHHIKPFRMTKLHMNKAFTKKNCPGQNACFMALFHVSTTIIPYITLI